jgi:hypothetical protein
MLSSEWGTGWCTYPVTLDGAPAIEAWAGQHQDCLVVSIFQTYQGRCRGGDVQRLVSLLGRSVRPRIGSPDTASATACT